MNIASVSVEECKKKLKEKKEKIILLDVRTENEHSINKIAGSVLIPLNELQSRIGELDKQSTILVYCATGNRSQIACSILNSFGFEYCFNVIGGIDAWQKAGYETQNNKTNNSIKELFGF